MKIAIFGAGKAGRFLYDELNKVRSKYEISAFIDNFCTGEYEGCPIYTAAAYFETKPEVDAIIITAGAQKTLKTMVNTCLSKGYSNLYMMHDIVGKCKLSPLSDDGDFIPTRLRKLVFSDDKPSLHYFEVPVTDNCNLNCKGCLFASNLSEKLEHIPLAELKEDATRMATLFCDVPWIRILGGEPLMHPDIMDILKTYRELFPDSEIDLCTNGLLIPKMNEDFWDCIIKNRISIHVSGYRPTYGILDRIDRILSERGIPYVILKREEFYKYYTNQDCFDIEDSYINCIASGCYELYRGTASSCSAVIAFQRFNEIFHTDYKVIENEDWINVRRPDVDGWMIKKVLESPSNACRYCDVNHFEKFDWGYASRTPDLEEHIIVK